MQMRTQVRETEESRGVEHELPAPLSMTARRTQVPLGFKHPEPTNTAPAGLYKAITSGDNSSASAAKESKGRSRCIVRS